MWHACRRCARRSAPTLSWTSMRMAPLLPPARPGARPARTWSCCRPRCGQPGHVPWPPRRSPAWQPRPRSKRRSRRRSGPPHGARRQLEQAAAGARATAAGRCGGATRAPPRQAAFSEREPPLVVVLGLWGAQTGFELPDRLPELPAQPQELPGVESRVLQQRLDLQLAVAQWARQRASRREPGAPMHCRTRWVARPACASWGSKPAAKRARPYHGYRTAWDLAKHYREGGPALVAPSSTTKPCCATTA